MSEVTVKVIGVNEIVERFKQSSIKTRTNIATAISLSVMQLVNDVKINLTGRYLNVRTGLLRNSAFAKTSFGMGQIKGTVGTNAYYGRIHHFGYEGTYNVKTHMRKMNDKQFPVMSHNRTVKLRPRPYLTDALEARRDEIVQRILKSVEF